MEKIQDPQEFLTKYNKPLDTLDKLGIEWKNLEAIFYSYQELQPTLEQIAEDLLRGLEKGEKVEYSRFRIKDPEHLIEKIIRKKEEKPDNEINIDNYKDKIEDLIGFRLLHIFKDDWIRIHKFISTNYKIVGEPKAYVRHGDNSALTEKYKRLGCVIDSNNVGYRSVHYIIEIPHHDKSFKAEIQVRTIFDEGWSEVDHLLRYPYELKHVVLTQQSKTLNRLAENADEMATGIRDLASFLRAQRHALIDFKANNEKLLSEIDKLSISDEEKNNIKNGIKQIYILTTPELSMHHGKPGEIIFSIDKPSVNLITGMEVDRHTLTIRLAD